MRVTNSGSNDYSATRRSVTHNQGAGLGIGAFALVFILLLALELWLDIGG